MKSIVLSIFFLLNINVFSQQMYFNKRYDFSNNLEVIWTILNLDTGYLCVGGYNGILIQYLNMSGDLVWQKSIEDSNYYFYASLSNSLIPTIDGGYLLSSAIQDTTGNVDGFLVKFDNNFDSVWTKQFNWQYFNTFYQCKQIADGEYILIGAKSSSPGNPKTWLVKTDSLGNKIWEKIYYGYGGSSIIVTKEGNYLFRDGDKMTKTDTSGSIIWSKTVDGLVNIIEAINGDYIGCYGRYDTTLSNNFPQYTPALVRVDTSGTVIWQKVYGPSRYGAGLTSVFETSSGEIVAAGQSNHNNAGGGNGYAMGIILKTNSQGNSLWYKEYEYTPCDYKDNYLRDIKPTNEEGIIAAGFIGTNPIECPGDTGNQDMWVIKLDSCGCLYPGCDSICAGLVGVEEKVENGKQEMGVYPNPANDFFYLYVNFSFPAELILYDIFGRELVKKNLYNKNEKIEIHNLPSGIYAYRVTDTGGRMHVGKLLVER